MKEAHYAKMVLAGSELEDVLDVTPQIVEPNISHVCETCVETKVVVKYGYLPIRAIRM